MVSSLGYRTDLALLREQGSSIVRHGNYTVVRTPENPSFHWGNFVLLHHIPEPEELRVWTSRFAALFPGAEHVALGVDGTEARLGETDEAGMECQLDTVLTAERPREPARPNRDAVLRRLDGEADWAGALELMRATAGAPDSPSTRAYTSAKLAAMRAMHERGTGAWFGAFLGERLVSGLGVFRAGQGLARFQNVSTLAEYRGNGFAGNLVHTAGEYACTELGARTLVIVADPEDTAIGLYRKLGFADTETQTALYHHPG